MLPSPPEGVSGSTAASGIPVETTSVITLDLRTFVPASGDWLRTVPLGLLAGLLHRADGQIQTLDLVAGFLNGLAGQARDLAP